MTENPSTPPGVGWQFARRLAVVLGAVALGIILWQAVHVLLLMFAGLLLAILLRTLTGWVHRGTRLPDQVALPIVLVLSLGLMALAVWLMAPRVIQQAAQMQQELRKSITHLEKQLRSTSVGQFILRKTNDGSLVPQMEQLMSQIKTFLAGTVHVIGAVLVIVFTGIYLAAQPGVYANGIISLVPPAKRDDARHQLDKAVSALRCWLLGQLISMAIIGSLTGVALWALGIPLAFILGIIAGLLEFVPVFGPIIAAIPAVLLGFVQGPTTALYVLGTYLGIQWVESYLVMPIVQREAVRLPPVVTIASVTLAGLWFGLLGILLATPIAAVLMVITQMAYIRGFLGDSKYHSSWTA